MPSDMLALIYTTGIIGTILAALIALHILTT